VLVGGFECEFIYLSLYDLALQHISNILQEATLITRIFWPKDMDHLLNEMTCDRDAYMEILRNADESTTF
jgi:hypothetical protein